MNYFSYGSNMSTRRINSRVPGARKVMVGELLLHQLRFHKVGSKDGTAKCDAYETQDPDHRVIGVVFDLPEQEKRVLDRYEGLNVGYDQKDVEIRLLNGNIVEAFTYVATNIDPALRPLDWYKEHVLRGAREHRLPAAYISQLEAVPYDKDTDAERRKRELAIYC